MTIRSMYGVASHVASKSFIAGMECEIENIRRVNDNLMDGEGAWSMTEDGSLRNNGKEFISKPLPRATLLAEFDKLHDQIEYKTQDRTVAFSPRTSVHVHVNCPDLEPSQVRSIVLWYALFEPLFFLMVDESRRNNIHCVGLDQTVLSDIYKRNLEYLHSKWSKYSALNILPLNKYGTIEFRGMRSTGDLDAIYKWVEIIDELRHTSQALFQSLKRP